VANELTNNEDKIVDELNIVQGVSMDVGGYYKPDFAKASAAMRPSETLNKIIAKV
jgi:isocitrate dehydrogenase